MTRFTSLLSAVVLSVLIGAPVNGQVTFLDEQFEYNRSDPATGSWVGNVAIPQTPDTPFFASLSVPRADDADGVIRLTMIQMGALDGECTRDSAADGTIAFTFSGAGGSFHFSGSVSEDGQRYRGEVTFSPPGGEPGEGTPFEFARTPRPTDMDGTLAFAGDLNVQTIKIGMAVVLARTPAGNWVGHVDIPQQMLRAYPLVNFEETDDGFTADFPVPGGSTIEGALSARNQRLSGVLKQSGLTMPYDFARDLNYAYKEMTRPQEPKPPYPYEEREITVEHPDGFVLAGTLTIPNAHEFGDDPFPTAVLISGSGQQDRNEALLGHKPFLVLADHLTRHGIAVMRYDDRGVGGSGGLDTLDTATSLDFATDTVAVVELLKTLDIVDDDHIGLIGHSEGGLIAPLASTMTDDIDFMVFMAGPGVSGRTLLDVQRKKLSMAAGLSEEDADEQNRVINELIDAHFEGATLRELVNLAMKMNEEDPDPMAAGMSEEELRTAIRGQMAQLVNPWMTYFLQYDPAEALAGITCPVLALNGTLDLQVWHEQNLDAIERILTEAGADVTAIRYEGMNHLFQKATTGTVGEYSEIETTIEPEVLDDIANWILDRTGAQGPES